MLATVLAPRNTLGLLCKVDLWQLGGYGYITLAAKGVPPGEMHPPISARLLSIAITVSAGVKVDQQAGGGVMLQRSHRQWPQCRHPSSAGLSMRILSPVFSPGPTVSTRLPHSSCTACRRVPARAGATQLKIAPSSCPGWWPIKQQQVFQAIWAYSSAVSNGSVRSCERNSICRPLVCRHQQVGIADMNRKEQSVPPSRSYPTANGAKRRQHRRADLYHSLIYINIIMQ